MSSECYDDMQMTFFEESSRFQTIDRQRLVAEARHAQAEAVGRFLRKAIDLIVRPLVRLQRRIMLRRQLVFLDDRMLEDIGLRRSDIPTIVNTAYPLWAAAPTEIAVGATIHRLAVEVRSVKAGDDTEHPLAA
jgi:uncharacterized protein YjiS (DUF1127 family)